VLNEDPFHKEQRSVGCCYHRHVQPKMKPPFHIS